MPHPRDWQAGQMPHSSRGAGGSWDSLMHYVLHIKQNYILIINYFYLTWEKTTFSHFVSVDHIPLKVTLPCVNIGLSWNATQLIIPVSFVEPVAREHNWNPAVLTDSAHTAEGEWTTDDWSSWLNDTNTQTWNASGRNSYASMRFYRRTCHAQCFFLFVLFFFFFWWLLCLVDV